MTDTMDFAQWARTWEAMSRQAMSTFPAFGAQQPAWNPQDSLQRQWNESIAQWARPFAGGAPQSDTVERVMAGAQGYLGMLQSMAAGAAGQGAGGTPSWFEAMQGASGFAPAAPSWMNNPIAQAMRNFGGHGAQGLEQMMERFVAAAAPMFNDAKGLLTMPAFGHLREHQENAQKSAQALIEYQEQMARYNRLMLKVSENGFARFQSKLAEREEPGRQIDTVRGVYDVWIDAAEEAYAAIALSEEFRDVYGALVNAQMRVREHVQREVERLSTDLGMPTRSEIDSIGERLQALRREFRESRENLPEIEALRNEVAQLRKEIGAAKPVTVAAPVSNVVAFARPQPTVNVVVETPPAAAPRKTRKKNSAKGAVKTVASKAKPAQKTSAPMARAADKSAVAKTSTKADKPPSSFAASIARFARDSRSDAVSAFAKPAKRKSGKH